MQDVHVRAAGATTKRKSSVVRNFSAFFFM
jgi:hypothetical protein